MYVEAKPMSAMDKHKADDQHGPVPVRCTGHCEHVVERHGHDSHDDLRGGLGKALARPSSRDAAIGVEVASLQCLLGLLLLHLMAGAELAPPLPAHPTEQDVAREELGSGYGFQGMGCGPTPHVIEGVFVLTTGSFPNGSKDEGRA